MTDGLHEKAQGMVEYAMLIVLVAVVVIVMLFLFGNSIGVLFSNVVSTV